MSISYISFWPECAMLQSRSGHFQVGDVHLHSGMSNTQVTEEGQASTSSGRKTSNMLGSEAVVDASMEASFSGVVPLGLKHRTSGQAGRLQHNWLALACSLYWRDRDGSSVRRQCVRCSCVVLIAVRLLVIHIRDLRRCVTPLTRQFVCT